MTCTELDSWGQTYKISLVTELLSTQEWGANCITALPNSGSTDLSAISLTG